MVDIADWTIQAATRIVEGRETHISRIASIIATHAAPLMTLLREAEKEHDRDDFGYSGCRALRGGECSCGADAWNARIEAALTDYTIGEK